mgnify:CR=1 FL=1
MEVSVKGVFYGILIALIFFLVLVSFGIIKVNNKATGNSVSGDSSNIPEECKVPQGQDLQAWKEHLGHHSNTLYCLDYYK